MGISGDPADHDPAFDAVNEAGGGESEGFELAEEELIEHASHGDEHGTSIIFQHAQHTPEEETDVEYGEADDEQPGD
jgi:hypothetical protein